ncbi:unnamed protein product [Trifolium pratense]|uniref:Uncharacterized protein n=1 Tax=Trifolium pratense TaxID=57577 RepID=A0ACB0IU71_TRIPR|nr:unnamed protein product [Trifolium pratense]
MEPLPESPMVESPVVKSPMAEFLVVESPRAESPVVKSPMVESLVVESPMAESPVAESSMAESLVTGDEHSPNSESVKGKHVIDTAAPFESVKDAVFKFGGIVDWKNRRTQSMSSSLGEQRSKIVVPEFGKTNTAEELESTKKLIEELRLNLESVERDELQIKEEAELVIRKIHELEQDIAEEASFEAKAQLEVEKSMHSSAVLELELMKNELDSLRNEYDYVVNGRDIALNNADEAVAASKEIEKAVEDLTAELIATKESLNSTRTAHLEAEEQTSGAVDEETHKYKLELKQSEEELDILNQQVLSARILKSKLEASSSMLLDLKAELAAYMESKVLEDETNELRKKELEEVKMTIEKATSEVNSLKEASILLQSELEEEKLILNNLKESEEKASAKVTELQVELEKSQSAIAFLQMKENETREIMAELPKKLQAAAEEADEAKSFAQAAQAELIEAQEEAEQAKASLASFQSKLQATQKEIGAAKVSEKLAKDSIKALERSESCRVSNNNEVDTSSLVTLTLDEYHELSKRTQKAEEQANLRIQAANSMIDMAKESEMRSLDKLEELNEELCVRRESLKIATENAAKAADRKSAVEHELRTWKAEQEVQRIADEVDASTAAAAAAAASVHVHESTNSSKGKTPLENDHNNETGSSSASDAKKKKKKKSLFPSKVIMFFAKRKTHPSK